MGFCRTGRHYWLDELDAARCCNGWRRELRILGEHEDLDPQGRHFRRPDCAGRWVYGWVAVERAAEASRTPTQLDLH